MSERTRTIDKDQWVPFPIKGGPFTLLWKTGESGLMPDINSVNAGFLKPGVLFTLTIDFSSGSYLDINPGLHVHVDATGNRFVDGGGDCALIEKGNPVPLVKLSDVVAQEKAERMEDRQRKLKETLLKAREKQMWEIPGENLGMYPPDALRVLYGKGESGH